MELYSRRLPSLKKGSYLFTKQIMNNKLTVILLSVFIQFSALSFAQNAENVKTDNHSRFFTEADTSNWVYVIKNKSLVPTSVFNMGNGVLQVSGISSGYLRTKKEYTDYVLKLEWRWIKKAGNSGVLVHIQPVDSIWPVCYQIQQKADAAGDIICMNGLSAKECTDSVKFTVIKQLPSNEKVPGEWNTMKVISKKNSLKVYINGKLQNHITGLNVKEGFIGFQNEGVPLEFQNLSIH